MKDDWNKEYMNRHPDAYSEKEDNRITIAFYQDLFAYCLEQDWFKARLPEIRKHVKESVLPTNKDI